MRPDTTPLPLPIESPSRRESSVSSSSSQSFGPSQDGHDMDGRTADGGSPTTRRRHRDIDGQVDGHSSLARRRSSHAEDLVDGGHAPRRRRSGGEDRLTVRRREANRLAAQRFRSRKKGYQDSLEERVKVLEQEKEVLIRQLDESSHHASSSSNSLQTRSSNLRHMNEDGMDGHRWTSASGSIPRSSLRSTGPSRRSLSPDRRDAFDADVRIAALESANRRLQEDIRAIFDENDQLRAELRRWRTWSRESGEDHSRRQEISDGDQFPRVHRPGITPLESPSLPNRAYSNTPSPYTSTNSHPSSLPIQDRKESYGHPPSSSDGKSLGLQLPPLRLPPIRIALSPDATTLPSPSFSTSRRGFGGLPSERLPHL